MSVTLYGFTLIRNALKYDYCFRESLASLSGLVNKVFIALGNSEDNTEMVAKSHENVELIHTVWDKKYRQSGYILAQQTNIALQALKQAFDDLTAKWGFYLQADEVIDPRDYQQILSDIAYAEMHGYDAVRFRYLHFWEHHNQIAISKKWYPHEVRAVKLNRDIWSTKDAQGFKNVRNPFESDVIIYHFGHVRVPELYRQKTLNFKRLYTSDEKEVQQKIERENRKHARTRTLPYYGFFPVFMKQRIISFGHIWQAAWLEDVYIKAAKEDISSGFIDRINAGKVHFIDKISECPRGQRKNMVILNPGTYASLRFPSKVGKRTFSKLCRPFHPELKLMLKLSEKGIGMKNDE